MLAFSRPFWPLFLHVAAAITLAGATGAAVVLAWAGTRAPETKLLARSTFGALLTAALPAWVVMRLSAQWIYSKEGWGGSHDPTWLGVGFFVADAGLLVLLATTALAYWWTRSGRAAAARIVATLSSAYLVLLVIGWLAMSGKWGCGGVHPAPVLLFLRPWALD